MMLVMTCCFIGVALDVYMKYFGQELKRLKRAPSLRSCETRKRAVHYQYSGSSCGSFRRHLNIDQEGIAVGV